MPELPAVGNDRVCTPLSALFLCPHSFLGRTLQALRSDPFSDLDEARTYPLAHHRRPLKTSATAIDIVQRWSKLFPSNWRACVWNRTIAKDW